MWNKTLGEVIKSSYFQKGNFRVVTRIHTDGTSMTMFDTTNRPFKTLKHEESKDEYSRPGC